MLPKAVIHIACVKQAGKQPRLHIAFNCVLAWYVMAANLAAVQEVGPVSAVAVALVTETSCTAPVKAPSGH